MAPPVAQVENIRSQSKFFLLHSPPALTHPQALSILFPAGPHTLLLLTATGFCVPASLPGPALQPGARPRQPLTSRRSTCAPPSVQPHCVSGSSLSSTFRPLIGFPFSSVNSKHLFRKQGLQDLAITVCPTSLPQHSSFLLALPNKQQSFKRLHFSLPILKIVQIHQHKRVFKQLVSLRWKGADSCLCFKTRCRHHFP